MNKNNPPVKKVVNIFRLSRLINNGRFIRYGILVLFLAVIVIFALLARGLSNPNVVSNESATSSVYRNAQPGGGVNDSTFGMEGSTPVSTTPPIMLSAYARVLLSPNALNSIRDIWSTKTTPINNVTQIEYNLTDTAGISFVSNSGDYKLSIEMYHFINDVEMAQKVAQSLKDIYLKEMKYENTNQACPVAVNEPSWILVNESHTSFLLGKAIPNNFISLRISSDGYIDTGEAVDLMCKIVEKQVIGLKDAGY